LKTILSGTLTSLLFTVALGLGVSSAAGAQDFTGQKVSAVKIQGLERVSEQVVRAKLEVQPGQDYNPRAVARDVRRIYELGHFLKVDAELSPESGGAAVTYVVEEQRVIAEIKVIGNKKMKIRRLRGVLKQQEGQAFLPEACEEERKAILDLYESKGFANSTVDVVADKVGPSRVRITYNIQEGKKARIDSINFVGNDALTRRQLKKSMKTRPAWWFLGGKYDEDKFEADLNNILDEYGNRGRLEADVPKTDMVYSDNGKKMDVTIYLSEGPEYHVEELGIANNEVFDDDEILNIAKVHAGDVHNKGQVAKDAELVQKGYQDSGYVNAVVTPQVTLDRENKTTHVIENVQEGDLKYLKEIKVSGNEVTKDEVVRREMMIEPGDRYDGSAVKSSQRRLENTRYFEAVRMSLEDLEDDLLSTNLLVDVEEGKTGNFSFGAGYSTDDGVGGFGELRLNNFDITNWPSFSGGGQQFRLKLNLGDRRDQYSLSFTEPEVMGYPIAMGFDLYDESYRVRGGANYTEKQRGGQLRFGKSLSPYVTVRKSFRYQDTELSDLPFYVNREIRRQRESNTTISSIWQIERNTLDNYRDPSSGLNLSVSAEMAGLGGDNHFIKLQHDAAWYRAFGEEKKWVLMLRTREGWATEYGSSDWVPLQDRFFAGGTTTVRGYDNRDIGPKVREYLFWGDTFAIGGNIRIVNNFEMKYKITDMFRLYSFVDSGGVWEDAGDFDLGDIKYSAGLGFGVDVPRMGPIRVDYGIPLNPDDDQGSGRLHLTTGFSF
jgi:outer membrane protein insertion porin family